MAPKRKHIEKLWEKINYSTRKTNSTRNELVFNLFFPFNAIYFFTIFYNKECYRTKNQREKKKWENKKGEGLNES